MQQEAKPGSQQLNMEAPDLMTATASENVNFFWHCQAAEVLIRSFMPHLNASVSSNIRHAVRMATLCAAGKNGIQYATEAALAQKNASALDWHKLGLIREHAVPISLIHDEVIGQARQYFTKAVKWSEITKKLNQYDHQNWRIPANTQQPAPLSAVIAAVIRERTVLVWATKADDNALNTQGLKKTMPPGKTAATPLARYDACGIKTVRINAPLPDCFTQEARAVPYRQSTPAR